jgi:hypothetical protein
MRFNILTICISIAIISLIGCSKEAGEGGTASISGKIFAKDYVDGWLVDSFYAPDQRIFIMYGNSTIYDDDMRTHYDGSYKFSYLYPGSYTLYAYSNCATCPGGTEAVTKTVEISQKGQILEVEDLKINTKELGEKGTAVITGKIFAQDWTNGFLVDSFYVSDERVYIMHGSDSVYYDDMRTNFDGSYRFQELYPGSYKIYTYTDCTNCPGGTEAAIRTINITQEGQVVQVPDIRIRT